MVTVVDRCIECIGFLAKGLRSEFAPHFKALLLPLLDKFKVKRVATTRALHDALIEMHPYCYTLLDIVPELTEVSKRKTPAARQQVMVLVTSLLKLTPKSYLIPKKIQPICLLMLEVGVFKIAT
jgi:cytoskeleton-associated protein 5